MTGFTSRPTTDLAQIPQEDVHAVLGPLCHLSRIDGVVERRGQAGTPEVIRTPAALAKIKGHRSGPGASGALSGPRLGTRAPVEAERALRCRYPAPAAARAPQNVGKTDGDGPARQRADKVGPP